MMVGIAAHKDFMFEACKIVGKKLTDESFGKENVFLPSNGDRWMTTEKDLPATAIAVCANPEVENENFMVFKLPDGFQSEEDETVINYMKAMMFDHCLKIPEDITAFVDFEFKTYYI